MAFTFNDEASVPAAEKDNEFRDVVAVLAATPGKVVSYIVTGTDLDDAKATYARHKRLMAEAGNELEKPVTIRAPRIDEQTDGKSLKVYLTATAKIKRTRKAEKAAAPAAVPAAVPAPAKAAAPAKK